MHLVFMLSLNSPIPSHASTCRDNLFYYKRLNPYMLRRVLIQPKINTTGIVCIFIMGT